MSHPVVEGWGAPVRTGVVPGFSSVTPGAGPPVAARPARLPAAPAAHGAKPRRKSAGGGRTTGADRPIAEIPYHRLVRDLVPELLERGGKRAVTKRLPDHEAFTRLTGLLVEGAGRIARHPTVAEFAELIEIVRALCDLAGIDMKNVERERLQKRDKRGGYRKGIVLEKVIG